MRMTMEKNYRIADLTVRMDTFGRTLAQAEKYLAPCESDADIVICNDWRSLKEQQPHLSEEDCEYLTSGWFFYRQLLDFDGMMLHASAVLMDGRAYLFSASPGTGKSTHTKLWQKVFGDRAQILNDDKPALRHVDGVWYAYGTPWSGKHDASINTRAPIAGICILERGEKNTIEPFSGPAAVCAMMGQTSRIRYGGETSPKILTQLDRLMCAVPIWRLKCNMDPEAALVSYRAMSGENQ